MNEREALQKALAILREFHTDVEAAGRASTRDDWPDLFVTFQKAEHLLIQAGTGAIRVPA